MDEDKWRLKGKTVLLSKSREAEQGTWQQRKDEQPDTGDERLIQSSGPQSTFMGGQVQADSSTSPGASEREDAST